MEITNGALLLKLRQPDRVLSVIPRSKLIDYNGKTLLAVKHGLEEVQVLRNLGINAPSPVNHRWTYPGRYKPMAHQKDTVDFLTVNKRAFVLNDRGTGKSASALWAADYLMTKGFVRRMVIVTPLSTLHATWEQECFNIVPHRTVAVLHGGKQETREALVESSIEILLVNHDGLASVAKAINKQRDIDLIVVDEAAAYRNPGTTRFKVLNSVIKPERRVWLMTGTPAPNAPTDVWALCKLIRPEMVPPYFSQFKMQTMMQITSYKWVPKPGAYDVAYQVMQPAVRYRLEDCVDLPPTTYMRVDCEMSPEQTKAIKQLKHQFAMETAEGVVITAVNAAVKLTKILQVGLGVVRDDDGTPRVVGAKSRLAVLDECIEESRAKVIVFVPYRAVLRSVVDHLREHWTVEYVDGSVSATKRGEIFDAFQRAPDPRILVAHPATTAHGLTLTAADTIVWYGPIFSNELFQQANARIVRTGQTKHTNIIEICGSEFEQEVYRVVKDKEDRQQKILNLYNKVLDKDYR